MFSMALFVSLQRAEERGERQGGGAWTSESGAPGGPELNGIRGLRLEVGARSVSG